MSYDDANREAVIRASIKSATDKNITLSVQTYGVEWSKTKERWQPKKDQKCCPLGCILLEHQDAVKNIGDWRNLAIATILQCDTDWLQMFQRGFDGYPRNDVDQNAFPYDLGFMLRCELLSTSITSGTRPEACK